MMLPVGVRRGRMLRRDFPKKREIEEKMLLTCQKILLYRTLMGKCRSELATKYVLLLLGKRYD